VSGANEERSEARTVEYVGAFTLFAVAVLVARLETFALSAAAVAGSRASRSPTEITS